MKKRLTDAGGVDLDLREQLIDLISLTIELTLSDDGTGQSGGRKGKDGEENGLHFVVGSCSGRDDLTTGLQRSEGEDCSPDCDV